MKGKIIKLIKQERRKQKSTNHKRKKKPDKWYDIRTKYFCSLTDITEGGKSQPIGEKGYSQDKYPTKVLYPEYKRKKKKNYYRSIKKLNKSRQINSKKWTRLQQALHRGGKYGKDDG